MKIEITKALASQAGTPQLIDNHSFLNLFNVLHTQLQKLYADYEDPTLLQWLDFPVDVLLQLGEEDFTQKLDQIEAQFVALAAYLLNLNRSKGPALSDVIAPIQDVIEVATNRISEFRNDRYHWVETPASEIERKLFTFLLTTERVSKGRFHFEFPPDLADRQAYRIHVTIEPRERPLLAPIVLHDLIRDLTANARKYSNPGSDIWIEVRQIEHDGVALSVKDQGIGIPEPELEHVVDYGYRASNVELFSTMGGGFGLTKAYMICKFFKGRFFIDSTLDHGTTVELTIFPKRNA